MTESLPPRLDERRFGRGRARPSVKKGEVGWSDADGAETHAVDNLGGVLRELFIEFKR